VQQIYNGNYQFAVAPTRPIVHAEAGDHSVKLTWDDAAERSVDPVTNQFDFEGYRVYRSTDPDFLDARVVTDASGQPTGNGQPIAQFDAANGITGYFPIQIENLPAYYLGTDTGVRHTFEDPTVTNGQDYYYAVCAYDRGSEQPLFYPSENNYSISRTLRGGVLYPTNVVKVRPNPRVTGFERAIAGTPRHVSGRGVGDVAVEVANSTQVPNGHRFRIEFANDDPDSVRANSYSLVDSTTGQVWFTTGNDFVASGRGPVGAGILPIVSSLGAVRIDTDSTRLVVGSNTNAKLLVSYQPGQPVELRRPGFPENLEIRFSDSFVDTSVAFSRRPVKPAKFQVIALTDTGETRMRFAFLDTTNATTTYDGTLSLPLETIDVLTKPAGEPDSTKDFTWRLQLDPTAPRAARCARRGRGTSSGCGSGSRSSRAKRSRSPRRPRTTRPRARRGRASPTWSPIPTWVPRASSPRRSTSRVVASAGSSSAASRSEPWSASITCTATWSRRCARTVRSTASCRGTCGRRTTSTWRRASTCIAWKRRASPASRASSRW
jgi:hypothetical protein